MMVCMADRGSRRFSRSRDDRGVAAVEFALILPVLITLFYGVIEITRFILISQKTEKLAHSIADVTAQSTLVTIASLDQLMSATADIMNPFPMGVNGRVIITSIYRPAGTATTPSVNWRYTGGGTLAAVSQLGDLGAAPNMPQSFTFEERENVIAAEVYYQFSPLMTTRFFGNPRLVYRAAFYKPRLGALTSPPT